MIISIGENMNNKKESWLLSPGVLDESVVGNIK